MSLTGGSRRGRWQPLDYYWEAHDDGRETATLHAWRRADQREQQPRRRHRECRRGNGERPVIESLAEELDSIDPAVFVELRRRVAGT